MFAIIRVSKFENEGYKLRKLVVCWNVQVHQKNLLVVEISIACLHSFVTLNSDWFIETDTDVVLERTKQQSYARFLNALTETEYSAIETVFMDDSTTCISAIPEYVASDYSKKRFDCLNASKVQELLYIKSEVF